MPTQWYAQMHAFEAPALTLRQTIDTSSPGSVEVSTTPEYDRVHGNHTVWHTLCIVFVD